MVSKACMALACMVALAAIIDCAVAASDVDELDSMLVSMSSGRSGAALAKPLDGMDFAVGRKLMLIGSRDDTPADEAGPAADYLAKGFRFLANVIGGAADIGKIVYGGFCIFAGCSFPSIA